MARLTRALTAVAIALVGFGCGVPVNDSAVTKALQSTDTVTVYNAGVEAYRAKQYEKARALWRHAADLGDHTAESNLGFLLYHGYGGPPDSGLATEYWRRAMIAQDAEAHRHVAEAILGGDVHLGTAVDAFSHALASSTIASHPGQLAGDQVGRDAKRLVDSLSASLPPSQIGAARVRGMKWATPHGYP